MNKYAAVIALLVAPLPQQLNAFAPVRSSTTFNQQNSVVDNKNNQLFLSSDAWNGEVASNTENGEIRGCTITQVEGSMTEWVIGIDGVEADLGKFSEAIYRKITSDAKQQRFQGFRPGTIPPHLQSTYIGFAMDECAREATLEAMSQNNIKPFDEARNEFEFDSISILPPKKGKKKKSKKRKKQTNAEDAAPTPVAEEPKWVSFETMKEAISAGWKPGQSFSFMARKVKGQKLNDQTVNSVTGTEAIGASGSALNLNTIQFDGE